MIVLSSYAEKVFAELPGSSYVEKRRAIKSLVDQLRSLRDALPRIPRRAKSLSEIRDELADKEYLEVRTTAVVIGGSSYLVTALMVAALDPNHSLHAMAKQAFAEVNLEVVTERSPGQVRGRSKRRIVDKTRIEPLLAKNAIVARILRIAGQGRKVGDK